MKRYIKELAILTVQLFLFYLFPLFAGPTDAMGMVFLIIYCYTKRSTCNICPSISFTYTS